MVDTTTAGLPLRLGLRLWLGLGFSVSLGLGLIDGKCEWPSLHIMHSYRHTVR